MSTSFGLAKWLRRLGGKSNQRARFRRHRTVHLEHLESRYVLTGPPFAPDAVDDEGFMNVSTEEAPVGQFAGTVLALHNDTDRNGVVFANSLEIVAVNGAFSVNGEDLSIVTHDVTIDLDHGTLTVRYQNSHLEHFDYVPDFDFTGDETFTYEISDGSAPFSDPATVTIHVRPYTGIGDDVTEFIHEGDGVHLSDLRIEDGENPEDPPVITHRSAGPDLEYYWFIDTTPGADPNEGGYVPPEESLVEFVGGLPVDRSTSVLDLSWEDLAAFDITDGGQSAVVTLKVVDANDFEAFAYTSLGVAEFAPTPTVFALAPFVAGGCGDSTVVLSAAFIEPNRAENTFTVSIDWNILDSFDPEVPDPTPPEPLTYTDNGDGTYTVAAATHEYAQGVDYLPMLYVVGEDADEESPFPFPFNGSFLLMPAFPADLPYAKIRSPGTQVDLVAPDEVGLVPDSYTWSVTKDGLPFIPDTLDDAEFSYTTTDPGVYIARVVEHFPDFGGFSEFYEDTTIVTGSETPPPVNGAILTPCGDLLVGGTSGDDTITLTPVIGGYTVTIASTSGVNQLGPYAPTGSVQIHGYDGADTLTINGDSASNAFTIQNGSIVLNGLSFADHDIETRIVNARGSGDTVTVVGGAATVTGGSGSDTLIAATGLPNTWNITAQNAGNLGLVNFTSIEHLVGDSTADTFVLSDDEGVSNGIDGGGGTDTLNYGAYTSAVSVNLQSGSASHTGGISSIENVIGGSGTDSLTALNATNPWTISGANSGNINGAVTFAAFENLNGGNQVDTFAIGPTGSVSGTLDGNGGADVLSYSSYGSSVTVDLEDTSGTAVANFTSIASFVGSGDSDTLIGANNNNTWTMTSTTGGTVDGTQFSAFETLQGGTANDTFRAAGFSFTGGVVGGGGTDKLDYASYITAVNVDLGVGSATGFATVADIDNIAGGDGNDNIRGDDGANLISGGAGHDILRGGGGNDTLSGGAGSDILLGDAGDDILNGGASRDIMIGGNGMDTIFGNGDEDILIAGTTDYDNDLTNAALMAILNEWNTTGVGITYTSRRNNIMNGTGSFLAANGYHLFGDNTGTPTQTVHNDNDVDTLNGDGGTDWFFANQSGANNDGQAEDFTDRTGGTEVWNDTDF